MGVRGFLSAGSTEEGAQDARPERQGAVKEAASSLSHPSQRANVRGPPQEAAGAEWPLPIPTAP